MEASNNMLMRPVRQYERDKGGTNEYERQPSSPQPSSPFTSTLALRWFSAQSLR